MFFGILDLDNDDAKTGSCNGKCIPCFFSCSNYIYQNAWSGYEQGGFSTAAAACAIATSLGAYAANGTYYCVGSNYYRAVCISPVFSCPANSQPTGNSCTCNDPSPLNPIAYVPDSTGTSCVPVSTCTIPPLTKLTDLVAIDFDANPGHRWRPDLLTPAFVEHVACVERETSARGGTPAGTSAYRPEQYQRHLYEIVKKDFQLDADTMAAHPECQTLRDEITREMGNDKVPPPGHGLKFNQPVAVPGSSLHEKKIAFDMTLSGLTDTQMAEVYSICGVTHKAVRGEPWHTQ